MWFASECSFFCFSVTWQVLSDLEQCDSCAWQAQTYVRISLFKQRCVFLLCCVDYWSCSSCNAVVLLGWVLRFVDLLWWLRFFIIGTSNFVSLQALQSFTLWSVMLYDFWMCSLGYQKRASLIRFLVCVGLFLFGQNLDTDIWSIVALVILIFFFKLELKIYFNNQAKDLHSKIYGEISTLIEIQRKKMFTELDQSFISTIEGILRIWLIFP